MVVAQGDIFWADLPTPAGSEAGFRRPVVVIQSDSLNASRIQTVVCIPLTGNVSRLQAPGNVLLRASRTGLSMDSVASTAHVLAVDRSLLVERAGQVALSDLELIFKGLDIVLGR